MNQLDDIDAPHDETPGVHADETSPADQPPASAIPWERRRELGSFRAFFQTVFLVSARKGDLSVLLDEPVCMDSAGCFRRTAILYAVLATGANALVTVSALQRHGVLAGTAKDALASSLGIVLGTVVLAIGLRAVTGAVPWFACPKDTDEETQDRAIALSYYTSAPLSLLLATPIILGVCLALTPLRYYWVVFVFVGALGLLELLHWYTIVLRGIHSLAGRSARRTALAAVCIPLFWLAVQTGVIITPFAIAMWFFLIGSLG